MGKHDTLGAKLGPRIASLVSQSLISTHKGLSGQKHKLGMALFESMSDQISTEVDVALRPILERLLADPALHDDLRPHLEFMAHGHGQLKALVGSSLASAGILDPLAKIITNILNPIVYNIIAAEPHSIPDPGTVAQLVANGVIDIGQSNYAFGGQGFDSFWSGALIEAAHSYPALGESLEMFRRGVISEDQVLLAMKRAGVPVDYRGGLIRLAEVLLSPADAALAVLRGNMSDAEGRQVAKLNGVSASDFEVIIGNTGEPLGLETLLEAYRRGFVDKSRLERGIRQSRVRNEWIDVAERLRFAPMSTADAVESVVQNHISEAQGAQIAAQNGLEAEHFPILVQTAGAPLSRTEMNELVNRGLASRADFDQALRESRLKNKYVDKAFALRERLIPERTLVSMVGHGVLSHEDALHRIMSLGFDAVSAGLLVAQGSAQKTTAHRELAVSQVTALYEIAAITRDQAVAMLENLKYTLEEAAFVLEIADMKRIQRVVDGAVSVIRSRYVSHQINEQESSAALDELGVAAASRDLYLGVWSVERQVERRNLTAAQIHSAVKKGVMPIQDGLNRLVQMGYTQDDATILLEL